MNFGLNLRIPTKIKLNADMRFCRLNRNSICIGPFVLSAGTGGRGRVMSDSPVHNFASIKA